MAVLREIEIEHRTCYLGWPQVWMVNKNRWRNEEPRQIACFESKPGEKLTVTELEDGSTKIFRDETCGYAVYSPDIDVVILRRKQ